MVDVIEVGMMIKQEREVLQIGAAATRLLQAHSVRPTGNRRRAGVRMAGMLMIFTSTLTLAIQSAALPSRASADNTPPSGSIEMKDVFVKVKETAEVASLERGQLQKFVCEPGDCVKAGDPLAGLDDAESSLNLELAQIELQIAEQEHEHSVAISVAQATLDEAKQLASQARHEAAAAKALAASDITIQQASKESEVSKDELERAVAAKKEFSSSVSDQHLAKLTLARDQNLLKQDLARHDQDVSVMRSHSKESFVAQQEAAVQRLEYALSKAKRDHDTSELRIKGLQKQVAIAAERVERRNLRSPLEGMIVDKLCHTGEWVEAGESVLRIIQLDTLYAEGFVNAQAVTSSDRGRKVIVACEDAGKALRIEGVVVFVSPEVDRVSQQVLIRAEIKNPGLSLRPGRSARMWLIP